MSGEFGQTAGAWHQVADPCHLNHAAVGREENALPHLAAHYARVERYVPASIDRGNDRLRRDVEPIEATSGWSRLAGRDDEVQARRGGRWAPIAYRRRRRR